jgi:hypothetical protein
MRTSSLVTIAITALLVIPSTALSSPEQDKAEARREFDAGVESDKHKDWAGALDHYLRANDLLEHPFTIYNIAVDYEHLNKLREAAVWYRRYLDKATDPNDLAKVRQQLADLELRPGQLRIVSTPAGARAFVDDAPVGVTPVTVSVKGGSHKVTIESNGQRSQREVRLSFGEPQDVNISLGAQPAMLLVFGTPAGATIYVDGQPSGTLPSAQVNVTEGTHQVRVTNAGYASYDNSASVPAGGVTKIPVSLQRGNSDDVSNGPPGTSAAPSTDGLLIGYYIAGGGGVDASSANGLGTFEAGVSYGHADVGYGFGKIGGGVGSLESIGLRYTLSNTRIAPFIGANWILAPGEGLGVFAGLRADLARGPTGTVALLAQVGAYRVAGSTDEDTGSDSGAQNLFPVTVSLIYTYGRRIPQRPAPSPQ